MLYGKDYYGYVYQWKNKSNSMKYIGSHYGSVNDSYVGSGKRFKPAYDQNPRLFELEILEYITTDCKRTLIEREQFYLDQVDNIRDHPEYYNLNNYSLGGSSHITKEHIEKRSRTLKERQLALGLSNLEKESYKQKIKSRLDRIKTTGFTEKEIEQHAKYGYDVEVETPDGKIMRYTSLAKATKDLGIDIGYAKKVCEKKSDFRGYKVKILAEPITRCSKNK